VVELREGPGDRQFDGIGAVNGGATSVLLKDYPELRCRATPATLNALRDARKVARNRTSPFTALALEHAVDIKPYTKIRTFNINVLIVLFIRLRRY
jgi:hypothetical protein